MTSGNYLVLAVVFLLLAPILFWNARRLARQSADSVNWPSVDGQITKSEIREDSDPWFLGEYAYEVNGAAYSGVVSSLGPDRPDRFAMLETYPLGRTLPVHYRPDKPKMSTVEPGTHSKPSFAIVWSFAIVGLVFGALGLLNPGA